MPTPSPETTASVTIPLLPSSRVVQQSTNYGHFLRLLRNTTFLLVSIITLFSTSRETKTASLPPWISGYSMQCAVHLATLIWSEYKRRSRSIQNSVTVYSYTLTNRIFRCSICGYSFQFVGHLGLLQLELQSRNVNFSMEDIFVNDVLSFANFGDGTISIRIFTQTSPSRRWDKVFSEIWWVIGSICMVFGSKNLNEVAPRLFWLTLAFLAIDTLFAFIQYLLAVFLGGAVCFCFPILFSIMYFWCHKEGASDADISKLPKYIFKVTNDGTMVPMGTNGPDFSAERVCLTEDAECCICLCHYENGEQLHLLPCNHNFHAECIVKWLKLKAICPLCRYVIG